MKRTALCAAITAATSQLHAADIVGTVSNATQRVNFAGAEVELVELGRKTITAEDGQYQLKNIPAGTYTVKVRYIGAEDQTQQVTVTEDQILKHDFAIQDLLSVDEIVVYGQRSMLAAALNKQRNSNKVSSVVSADSIGQFPDQNAAEALARIPGLFIQRDQGEGRFVGIRGIDPSLNNVTINGVNVPSPEAGQRSVAMDVIPSELIEGLEVSKTVTPDMDADAIGGSVEVKSLSALDRNGMTYSFTAQGSHNELVSETSPKLSGAFTNTVEFDGERKFGIAAAASWFEREFGSTNVETDGGWMDITYGETVDGFGPEEIEQRAYEITRERLGFALNLDYQASLNHSYYLRTLRSEFSDDEYRQRNEYKLDDDDTMVDPATFTDVAANFTDAEMDRDTKDRFEEQTILSIVFGGEHTWDYWGLAYNMGYSNSEEVEPNRVDAAFEAGGLALGYVAGQIPTLIQDSAAHDLSNFELDEISVVNNFVEDEELSFKIDVTRAFDFASTTGEFKFGFKRRDREKQNIVDEKIYDDFDDLGEITAAQFEAAAPEWDLGDFGPGLSRDAIKAFTSSSVAGLTPDDDSILESLGQTYSSEEEINAFYAMVSLYINNWEIVAGARYEETSFSTTGNIVTLGDDAPAQPITVTKDYDHFLPNVNAKYEFTDQLLMRLAYTNTIARPTFGDSAAFQLAENDDGEITAEVGNPELEAYESTNYDVSIEYYPGDVGVLSAAYFYKDIDNFIIQSEVQDNGQWDGYEEVLQPVNGGAADISGVELAWTKSFESGLILGANATLSDADDKLPAQSDTVANITFGYENSVISARLTANHKSDAFQFEDNDSRVIEDEHTQWDFNVKYNVNDSLRVYFNAINLTDEPFYLYHGSRVYNYQYEEYGRSFEVGMTFTSF